MVAARRTREGERYPSVDSLRCLGMVGREWVGIGRIDGLEEGGRTLLDPSIRLRVSGPALGMDSGSRRPE